MLREARDRDDFLRNPVGASIVVETSLVWCASPTLGGSTCWGSPTADQTRRVLRIFDAILHPSVGPNLDLILDGHALETVDPAAALVLMSWTKTNLGELRRRIRRQLGVPPAGVGALLIAGILPILGEGYQHKVLSEPREPYRILGCEPLYDEIWGKISAIGDVTPIVSSLRSLLRARQGKLSVSDAAKLLDKSSRALQRELAAAATSFRAEQREVRMSIARELLANTDDKLAAVAESLGLSEGGFNLLVRESLGMTPEAWRRQLKSR
jgi:AraC-like DNA-binding protein